MNNYYLYSAAAQTDADTSSVKKGGMIAASGQRPVLIWTYKLCWL